MVPSHRLAPALIAAVLLAVASLAQGGAFSFVEESEREIPVAWQADVVVVGGTSGAVAAALEARRRGASVVVLAPRTYLGDDLCATYRLWQGPQGDDAPDLARKLFPGEFSTPMHVQRTLDQALLDANVPFAFGCYVTDAIVDTDGRVAGVVVANRAGRQAAVGKAVIDATRWATAARSVTVEAGPAKAWPIPVEVRRVVVGGKPVEADRREKRLAAWPRGRHDAHAYTLELPLASDRWSAVAELEQAARDRTWSRGQQSASRRAEFIPPVPLPCQRSHRGPWPGADRLGLECLRPRGTRGIWLLGPRADVDRHAVDAMLAVDEFVRLGRRVGARAVEEARGVRPGSAMTLPKALLERPEDRQDAPGTHPSHTASPAGDIRERLAGPRGLGQVKRSIASPARRIPVIGRYDVVVVGGGTAGAPAGIAAASNAAKTLLVEYLHGLGGTSTLGQITKYYYGNRVGFTKKIDEGVKALGGDDAQRDPQAKMEWYRRQLRAYGADIWLHTMACGVVRNGRRITGVVVVTPMGRGVVLAEVVIDATGNAVVAADAGAACMVTGAEHVAMQGAGLRGRNPGDSYNNSDWTFSDPSDLLDIWRTFVVARRHQAARYDLGTLIQTRERRRIVGDYVLSPLDIYNGRTFPDTITIARSNFDTHGFTVHPSFLIRPPDRKTLRARVPFRCLLPRQLDGVLATGLGASAHRDAMPVIRMIPDVQNQGFAAGTAAAMACEQDTPLRKLNVRDLQRRLVSEDILPPEVLEETDSFPLPDQRLRQAVAQLGKDYRGVEVVLTDPNRSLPMLRDAWRDAADDAKARLAYAHVLGICGDATGVETLLEAVAKHDDWDKGWNFRGMGQFGASLSELDSLVIALGRTRDPRALNALLPLAEKLDRRDAFSHFRALAVALETLGDPRAAEPLARVLRRPGIAGHAVTTIEQALAVGDGKATHNGVGDRIRNRALIELLTARALFRCGDHDGLGRRTLQRYVRDLHGLYARHARAVLDGSPR